MNFDIPRIVEAARSVLGPGPHDLQVPPISKADRQRVADCLLHEPFGYEFINLFEAELAEVATCAEAVAVTTGTDALRLALIAAGVKPGDEVILPSLTFVGSANAVVHVGAIPNFADVNSETLGLHPHKLRKYLDRVFTNAGDSRSRLSGRRLGAIVGVDLLGIPCDEAVIALADYFRVPFIEDAAEAIGSTTEGRMCGARGGIGIFSFNNNKLVSTNGGGAVLCQSPKQAATVRRLATTAKLPHPWRFDHTEVAWNNRMPDICAALGLGQVQRLPSLLASKQNLARRYAGAFAEVDGVSIVPDPENSVSNRWLNGMLVHYDHRDQTEPLLQALHEAGIRARAIFTPMHKLPMFKDCPRDTLGMTDDLANRLICLPSSVGKPD